MEQLSLKELYAIRSVAVKGLNTQANIAEYSPEEAAELHWHVILPYLLQYSSVDCGMFNSKTRSLVSHLSIM